MDRPAASQRTRPIIVGLWITASLFPLFELFLSMYQKFCGFEEPDYFGYLLILLFFCGICALSLLFIRLLHALIAHGEIQRSALVSFLTFVVLWMWLVFDPLRVVAAAFD